MDDFQLGLSSGAASFRDDFYESFQAPKYYDFNDPQDPEYVDEWFLKRTSIASLKEELTELIYQSKEGSSASGKKPAKAFPQRFGWKPKDKVKQTSQLDENEDPNQAARKWKRDARTRPNEAGETGPKQEEGRKKDQPLIQAQSPVPVTKPVGRIPATVPQNKKVLSARRAALEVKQDFRPRTSKALFAEPAKGENSQTSIIDQEATVAAAPANSTNETAAEQRRSGSELPSDSETLSSVKQVQRPEKNYSSEFEESCRQSGELPKCKRALVATNDEMIEQAEVALKSLILEDGPQGASREEAEISPQDESESICEEKQQTQLLKPPVFAFAAVRKDPNDIRNGRKRKSAELYPKGESRCRKVAPASPARLLAKSKKLRITCPQPFRLRTEERAALKGAEFNKKAEEYASLRDGLGLSSIATTKQPKAAPVRRSHRSRKLPAVKPSTNHPAANPVTLSIEMLAKDLQRNDAQDKQEHKLHVRKGTNTHAMPSFDRPFKPQRSTKKLTIPVEPRFHSIHGRRTCAKHSLVAN